jgi:N-acyl-D-aspartate/D-glutamate deacylase
MVIAMHTHSGTVVILHHHFWQRSVTMGIGTIVAGFPGIKLNYIRRQLTVVVWTII